MNRPARFLGGLNLGVISLLVGVTVVRAQSAPGSQPERWVLAYAGGPGRPAYSADQLVQLIAGVDTAGHPTSWLFNGTLFLEFKTKSGRSMLPLPGTTPADGADWGAYLDALFGSDGALARLDSAVGRVRSAVGPLPQKFRVAIMIPYPDPRRDTLVVAGKSFLMGEADGRVDAARQYVTEVTTRFRDAHYSNLELQYLYWLHEEIGSGDTAVVRRVSEAVHHTGHRFLWVPYFGATGMTQWRSFGFDEAMLQPNFFFTPRLNVLRIDSAFATARSLGMGIEIEFDGRLFGPTEYADRLAPYLTAIDAAADIKSGPIALYEGAGGLFTLASAKDPWHRALYAHFVSIMQPPATGNIR